ncbi:putative inactive disease susceptibility protein LOV1 [Amaranthus tricolor]|uniref:putative inactive disease susceptibility protein LOV1 n=1 Tax=Amaranthus tricolor TaxID=29722 RepID=UPI002582D18A|nr:putative inactive disease susceptibility protein LOV1 [Amaranthus tricolor]
MEYLEELSRGYLIHIVKRNLEGRIKISQVPILVYEFCITKAWEENFLDTSPHQFGTSTINSRKVLFRSRWYNTLPEEIGMLVHLSYLGIRNTNIEQLPKSIEKLTKL